MRELFTFRSVAKFPKYRLSFAPAGKGSLRSRIFTPTKVGDHAKNPVRATLEIYCLA